MDTHEPEPAITAREQGSASDIEPRIFALLIGRIEELARELGRTEGRQMALQQQIARLEEQVAALRRGSDQG